MYAGWCNAGKGMDAWGAQNASFGNLWKATAEINESLYPHVQWDRDYRTDSGGPGQWRGLCGSHYEKEVLVDAKVYTYVVGMKYPMPGICGGKPGEPNKMIIRYGSDDPFVVKHTADWVPIAAGQRVMYDYGGGGGWGDPLDRDPHPVLDDVLDEYVSVEGATRDYGVVLTGSLEDLTLAVDHEATDRLRAERRAQRGRRTGRADVGYRGYRVGVDVGGTFTDVICVTPTGEVLLDKTPTTPDDQSTGVMNGLALLAERFGLSLPELCAQLDIVVHGTTTADNTMIEMDGAPTGLLVTEGHRDEIEMRRVHKEEIWDPTYPAPIPIARRRARIPDPRAHRPPRRGHAGARRGRGPPGRPAPAPARRHVDRGHVPVLVREPRPRAPRRGDHPRGVPRRRAHLAVARGDGAVPSSSGCRPRSSTRTSRRGSRRTSSTCRRSCAPRGTRASC